MKKGGAVGGLAAWQSFFVCIHHGPWVLTPRAHRERKRASERAIERETETEKERARERAREREREGELYGNSESAQTPAYLLRL